MASASAITEILFGKLEGRRPILHFLFPTPFSWSIWLLVARPAPRRRLPSYRHRGTRKFHCRSIREKDCPMRFCDSLNMRWISRLTIVCALGTFLIQGCGKREARPQGEQASVTGSLMFDGKSVALDTNIVFYCKDKDATAAGKVDSLGKFKLKAARTSVGIPVGRYVVTVRPPDPPMPVSAAAGPGSPDYQKVMMSQGNAAKPSTPSDIPIEFTSLDTSKLALEVQVGPNNFDIDMAKIAK